MIRLLILFIPIFCFSEGAGKVIGVFGTVKTLRNGVESALERGASVFQRDTIVTLKDSYAKIRFTDGSLVSIIPDSEYSLDSYQYKPDSSNNNAASTLAKGGLRCISGEIAKTNPNNYTYKTPTATMGVRGTIFSIRVKCSKDMGCTTFFGCDSGIITIKNDTGEVSVGPSLNYRYAEVSSQSATPTLRSSAPAELAPSVFMTSKMNKC